MIFARNNGCSPLGFGPSTELIELDRLIGGVAGQEKVVAWLDHPRESHKQPRIDAHGCKNSLNETIDKENIARNMYSPGGGRSVCRWV